MLYAGALIGLSGAVAIRGADAQVRHETRLEVGVARIEQPGTHARSAAVLGGVRHHGDTVLAALVAGNITWARDSVAALQGIGALAWRPSPLSPWQAEGGVSGAAFTLSSISRDANASGWLKLRRRVRSQFGVVGGASAGYTSRDGRPNHSTSVEAGAWAGAGTFHVELSAARVRSEDSLLFAASRVFTRQRSAWLDVDDIAFAVTWEHGRLELAASERWRRGARGTDAVQTALSGAVTYAFTPRYAGVITGGRLLADPLRGSPDAMTMMAVLRVTFAEVTTPPTPGRDSEASVAQLADGRILIVRVRASPTARVEIAGSFSGWEGVPVTHRGEMWEAHVRIPPGRHRVAFRVDGGSWRAPANLARLREFGGEVGLIVVP